jgi:CheY-like chemotaxis protein
MDLRMPGMDGNEAARESGGGKRRAYPIIALTAGVMEPEGSPAHHRYLTVGVKPFREAEIFEQMEKHLGVQSFASRPRIGGGGR